MKQTNKILVTFIALMLSFSFYANFTSTVKAEVVTLSSSQKYADAMEPGWNLGNTFDSFDTNGDKGEMSWGNPVVTRELIKTIKAQGFKSIRMPFTALMRTGPAPYYTIDKEFLDRYAEVVKWALDEDLYVMVNVHHDSWNWAKEIGSPSDNGKAMEQYKAVWTQLADYFKDYSDKVCFESLNEPQFSTGDTDNQIKILEEVNKEFYKIVRKSGGNNATRMMVLPTLNTNDSDDKCESLYNTIKGFNDENILATFHYYGFWPFSVNIAGVTKLNDQTITELEGAFDRVNKHFTANGIGVICGEYGLLGFDTALDTIEPGEVLKYFEYINYYAKQKKITMMLWDNGQHMGRTSLAWSNPDLYNMIKASWTSRSSYSESDRIFVTDQNKDKDISMNLTLNGNDLSSIYNEDKQLVLGEDYTYNDDTIVLKGSYINSLITDKYGVNAMLTMKFSAGADWNIYVNHYKRPELSPGQEGDASGLKIPVRFNGAKLSTLEAVYSDGTAAGPQSWTTYKQFGYAFAPDYESNKIIIKDKFFEEAKDGKIVFKLHFQSGEILEYNITKEGNIIK